MNKTAYKGMGMRRRQLQTQNNFRRQPNSPFHSQKSLEQEEARGQSLRLEMQLAKQYGITATSWCIYDTRTAWTAGVRDDHQREIASLTKIMTTIVSLELFQRYAMDKEIMIRISPAAAAHSGTTAELKEGKYIRLHDLFYGTMLPSGNDAAFLLAEVFGLLLFYESVKPQSKDYSEIQSIDLTCYDSTTTFLNRFLKEMNRKAKQLRLSKTVFTNPHGLSNIMNVSSAKDILALSRYCCGNRIFREVMNCEEYSGTFYEENMAQVHCVKKWTNTNKLLGMGWEGIKTGHTGPAGACLASVRQGVFIVVLNSANREARFEDTMMLWEWYCGRVEKE